MATRNRRNPQQTAYPGLAAFTDETQRQSVKLIYDKQQRIETLLAALQTTLDGLPRGDVSTDVMQAYVQQQVATLRSDVPPPTYGVVPGVPGDPNVVPGDALPLPNELATIQAVFTANPGFVATSCQEAAGGTWDLMNAIVAALRAIDARWGYNGSRGNAGDPSGDAVAYDFNPAGPTGEGSTTVYIVDVIAGHCGPSPSAAFQDVTVFAPGVWLTGPF
jgi:hypothetical protein